MTDASWGPVLEERAPPFQQVVELLPPVASAPGGQNHMVGAFDRGDAVDLDEAQPLDFWLDHPCKIFSLRRAPKAVPVEEQLPGSPVGEARQRFAGTATHENLAPIPRTRSQSLHSLQRQEFFGSPPGPTALPPTTTNPLCGTSPASGVGQVREVLDILAWRAGAEAFVPRPLGASYSWSSSSLTARI